MQHRAPKGASGGTKTRKYIFAIVLAAGAGLAAPMVSGVNVTEAARITASAVAEVIRSSTGITSRSNFEVGLPPVTDQQVEIVVNADQESTSRLNDAVSRARLISKPATFGVSGEPNQAYSVGLPSSPATTFAGIRQETVVVFSEFTHDAGVTPSLSADGKAVFAVGARVVALPVSESTNPEIEDDIDDDPGTVSALGNRDPLGLNLSDTRDLLTFADTSDERMVRDLDGYDPFAFALDPRFLNVLVSYN